MTKKTGKKQTRRKNPLPMLILLAVLLCELVFYTWVRIEAANTRIDISNLVLKKEKLKSMGSALATEKVRLSQPERISEIARSRLNMAIPSDRQIVYISAPVNENREE